jgi:metal-responsive CopG/Arc/MetJ family transcriptional regulator
VRPRPCWAPVRAGYDRVILASVKTAISIPDGTFARVDAAAARLGFSRSEFYARAAERWLAELESSTVTEEIDAALADVEDDTAFTDRAAAELAERTTS